MMTCFVSEIDILTIAVSIESAHQVIYFLGESIWIQTGVNILYQTVKCCWIIPTINIVRMHIFLNGLQQSYMTRLSSCF